MQVTVKADTLVDLGDAVILILEHARASTLPYHMGPFNSEQALANGFTVQGATLGDLPRQLAKLPGVQLA